MTDAVGKFVIPDLEPGTYRIAAGKNGFVRMNHGERVSGGPGTILNLISGQTMKDLTFRLVQTAVVSGRIRESSGEPGAGIGIQLLRHSYNVTGQRAFETVSSTRTDDRGEYRLFWISPGRYYLAVGIEGLILTGFVFDERPTGQTTVYYPGTVDPLRATSIEIGAGREVAGIDMVLPQQQLYRVRGRVVDSTTGQPPRTSSVSLIPRDPGVSTLGTSRNPNYNPATGAFDLRDVAPGQYWLRAQATDSTATRTITANLVGRTVSDALSSTIASRSMC
jgi:hypothetical protein